MSSRLFELYQARLAAGEIVPEASQAAAIGVLERVAADLAAGRGGLLRKPVAARGAYLFGPVGRGKSMLMDLFFAAAPLTLKRRVHFHVFMAEIHALIAAWRTSNRAGRRARFGTAAGEDPIGPAAALTARSARLLCFDELQVTDIADAMILGRLFEALFAEGVTLVATSNRPPDDLYADGINRQLFLPFIALLKSRMDIAEVGGDRDWRTDRLRAAGAWFAPIDPGSEAAFDALWGTMLGDAPETGVALDVLGRREVWPRASGGLLRAHFASLCGHALGPADYLAIADRFHTVFLEGLPRLTPARRDEARRLGTLIDTLYERRRRLVVLAEDEPGAIYPAGDQAFEFQRAASRLEEMRSADWAAG